ncbi:MAG: hypothetical protein ACREQ4_06290 [Candidatus Binataceae bacterium]
MPALLGAVLLNATPVIAAAGLPDIGIDMSEAKPLNDAQLGDMRGGFAPNGGAPVMFFGLVVESTVQAQNGNSLSAGAALGVNLNSSVPKIVTNLTWATQHGPGNDPSGPSGTPNSNALNAFGSGIGQVVQIAGDGNHAANQANIDLTTTPAQNFLPTSAPGGIACGSLCQASIKSNALQVGVNLPGHGSATQTINPQVILQGINLSGSLANATNTMNLYVQLGKPAIFDASGLTGVLHAIPR